MARSFVRVSPRSPIRFVAIQFASFASVGAIATAVQYVILVMLVQLVGMTAPIASCIGFAAGAIVSYGLNYRFTFRSGVRHTVALPKFATVAAIGLLLNVGVLTALMKLGLHYLLAQVAATGTVLCWNFLLNRQWTFGANGQRRGGRMPGRD